MKILKFTLLVSIIAILTSCDYVLRVKGVVIDSETQLPIHNVKIVRDTEGSRYVADIEYTDSVGNFEFMPMFTTLFRRPIDSLSFSFEKEGYNKISKSYRSSMIDTVVVILERQEEILPNTNSSSQGLLTKTMQWTNQNTIQPLTFQSIDKIIELGNSLGDFASVQSERFCIKDENIFILMVDLCSGISCLSVYVFREKGDEWELQTSSQARLTTQLKIRVDNYQEKILFETPSGQIGELPFNTVLQGVYSGQQ